MRADLQVAGRVALAELWRDRHAQEHGVHGLRHVVIDRDSLVRLDLDEHLECRRGLALEHALLCSSAAGLLVAQRDRLDAADEVRERRIQHEVLERVAVRGRDELHASLGDGARGGRFLLRTDLVDDDDLWHMVLDRLDHHRVLQRRCGDLHPARAADPGMRDIAVAGDLVRGVDDHHSLAHLVGEDSRDLAQKRRLTDTRTAEEQDASAGLDDVADDLHRSVHRAADAKRQAHDFARAVPQCRDAMQSALDPGAIVATELSDMADHVREVLRRDLALGERVLTPGEARLRQTPEVHDDLEQAGEAIERPNALSDVRGKPAKKCLELVALLHGHVTPPP